MSQVDVNDLFWPDLTLEAVQEDVRALLSNLESRSFEPTKDSESNESLAALKAGVSQSIYSGESLRFDSFSLLSMLGVESQPFLKLSTLSSESCPVYMKSIFDRVPVWSVPHDTLSSLLCDDVQARKDIGRDMVVLNGKHLKGSEIGYEGLLQRLTVITESEELSKWLLTAAGRTFSGGISLERVLDRFGGHGFREGSGSQNPPHLVVPLSAEAPPIEIVGGIGQALWRSITVYSLLQEDGISPEIGRVNAVMLGCANSLGHKEAIVSVIVQ